MIHVRYLLLFILLHLITATPQINLYHTNEIDNALRHDCLRTVASIERGNVNRQIISYCISESSSKFNIEENDFIPKFTFDELSKENITSQQLYLWSTPIDIIEDYQSHLNQLLKSNKSFLSMEFYYNCTLPRFGSMCQYEFVYYHSDYSSLYEMIQDFYRTYEYKPTDFTCYTHLQCNRGPLSACLDWSEICDEKIDCLDGNFDEEHCWQLEINQCNDNEYRCLNGQCIPKEYFRDDFNIPDCLDGSDEILRNGGKPYECMTTEPSYECEDVTCPYTFLTNSCVKQRDELIRQAMFSVKDNSTSDDCWAASKCILNLVCNNAIIHRTCPDMFYIPTIPVLFGHIYLAYQKMNIDNNNNSDLYLYICYNSSHYDDYFVDARKILFNNTTCYYSTKLLSEIKKIEHQNILLKLYIILKRYTLIFNYTSVICNRLNMYQCISSIKCIPINRLMDGVYDCPHMDDENMSELNKITEKLKQSHFKCRSSNKYVHQSLTENGYCDCGYIESGWCDDEDIDGNDIKKRIAFQIICNGLIDLSPIVINGQNETDETECEQWPCVTIYTHCDGLWNCFNGADETGCYSFPTLNCSSDHHTCISLHTYQFTCLPIEKANDGKIDCHGATDEPKLCRSNDQLMQLNNFYCMNSTSQSCIPSTSLCNGRKDCKYGDDEQFCEKNRRINISRTICALNYLSFASDVEKFMCDYMKLRQKQQKIVFVLNRMDAPAVGNNKNTIFSSSSNIQKSSRYQPLCHRGLDLRVWLNNLTTNTCLCPPSFYGNRCQYQNQRVSLIVRFRALSDSWQIPFAIVISLIDDNNERIIHSYEQFTYLSVRDCKIKFRINLLYSIRPKNDTKYYGIHVDIYEKFSLNYRGSLLFPITFPFLPVHRLAFIIDIPRNDDNTVQRCSYDQCVHGKCIRYSNNPQNIDFCQCHQGWSGQNCTIRHKCMCSSDSLCIGVSTNNRSVCLCTMNKFGSRCLLTDTICQTKNNSICHHGGQCIPNDDYMISKEKFVCICPKGFSGTRCEIVDNKLILSFEKNLVLSQSIFIHFIQVIHRESPIRTTMFQTIPVIQNSVIIHWSQPFHLVFIELLNKTYYLTVVQKIYNRSITIVKMINSSNRCPHISEIFNETMIQLHLLRRIKYYHLPCQQYSLNLSCFYDDIQLCLCYDYGKQRLANCFNFDHNMTFDCFGQSVCENGAQCFQDSPDCPKRSMCICRSCYYGTRCQFSTSGFALSLEAILGYHILPNVSFTHQPSIVKISSAFTVIFLLTGIINGVLSIITFKSKIICKASSGLYLFGSSVTTLFAMFIFGLKFWILILAQIRARNEATFC